MFRRLLSWAAYLVMAWRLYKGWSYLYRWVFEQQYGDVPLRTFTTVGDAAQFMAGGRLYRADSWRELFDAVSSPQRVQLILEGRLTADSGFDCDDHAIFLVSALDKSVRLGVMRDPILRPYFLTVMWLKDGKAGGHNACLLTYGSGDELRSSYAYMDYGVPGQRHDTISGVIHEVIQTYAPGAVLLAVALSEADLTPVLVARGPMIQS